MQGQARGPFQCTEQHLSMEVHLVLQGSLSPTKAKDSEGDGDTPWVRSCSPHRALHQGSLHQLHQPRNASVFCSSPLSLIPPLKFQSIFLFLHLSCLFPIPLLEFHPFPTPSTSSKPLLPSNPLFPTPLLVHVSSFFPPLHSTPVSRYFHVFHSLFPPFSFCSNPLLPILSPQNARFPMVHTFLIIALLRTPRGFVS